SIEVIELSLTQIKTTLSKVIIQMKARSERRFLYLHSFECILDILDIRIVFLIDQYFQINVNVYQHVINNAQADIIYRLKEYIDSHLDEDISLEVLSEHGGLSTQYISKLFKDVLHISFSDYITNARLEKSCALLIEQQMLTVTEISSMVG